MLRFRALGLPCVLVSAAALSVLTLTSLPRKAPRAEARAIRVVFRYDDFGGNGVARSRADGAVIEAFKHKQVPLEVGAIPFACEGNTESPQHQKAVPLARESAQVLRQAVAAGAVEVALHGYSHQTIRERSAGGFSEFSGMDGAEQFRRVSAGKELLDRMLETNTKVFIPPWNRYDANTLRMLDELGFELISADRAGTVGAPARVRFMPAMANLPQLKNAIAAARLSADPEPLVVVLFHAFDLAEFDRTHAIMTLAELDGLLGWVRLQKDVHAQTMRHAAAQMKDLSVQRYAANKYLWLSRIMPPLVPAGASLVYASRGTVMEYLRFTALFYGAVLAISASLILIGCRVFPVRPSVVAVTCAMLVVGIVFGNRVVHLVKVSFVSATAVLALLGMCAGSMLILAGMVPQRRPAADNQDPEPAM